MTEAPPERPYWEEAFFTALAQSGFIKRSAKAAGVTTGAIYNRRKKDAAFEARLQAALCDAQGGVGLPAAGPAAAATPLQWRSAFLHALAETSNVTASAERAGVKPRVVYELRRENAEFAARPQAQKEVVPNGVLSILNALSPPSVEDVRDEPPAKAQEGLCWLLGPAPIAGWAGHEGEIGCFNSGDWLFLPPADGMVFWLASASPWLRHEGGWIAPEKPTIPAGGQFVDAESRATLEAIINALTEAGIFPR